MLMKKKIIILLTSLAAFASCVKEEWLSGPPHAHTGGISFGLRYDGYMQDATRMAGSVNADYDRVEFVISDDHGNAVGDWKADYDRTGSAVVIEGLQTGRYRLMVLGIKGDYAKDSVLVEKVGHVSDRWISFPQTLSRPLEAEYFYSCTPFEVYYENTSQGLVPVSDLPESVIQKRILSRLDFTAIYGNRYVQTAVTGMEVTFRQMNMSTAFSADGSYSGSASVDGPFAIGDYSSMLIMPVPDSDISGKVDVVTRDYRGGKTGREYGFSLSAPAPNTISTVEVRIVHPDDESGTMFITERAYAEGSHGLMLQDEEHHSVYTDRAQRYFNTASPMQCTVDESGELNVRFYSPRPVEEVLLKARIPSVSGEYFDLAYFDRIPAFADFTEPLPMVSRKAFYRAEDGSLLEIPAISPSQLSEMEFKVESKDPYWEKLEGIIHGWNVGFGLYGGDPEKPDGGPYGNWMGIRPVHCREAVAFFLNFTYMIDMPEHEKILRENQDRLYGNGGVDDKVTVETVLSQMRQQRTVIVGLVYTGNGVVGLGGGTAFGAWQKGWLEHYTSLYACEVMFHELGHVMGYSHASSFTYGPWAQELMNNFYVGHLDMMPVDSPSYLKSADNPNLYK